MLTKGTPNHPYLLKDISSLTALDHLCGIFHNEDDQAAVVSQFLLAGLSHNERVLLYTSRETRGIKEKVVANLITEIDVEKYVQNGQLVFDDNFIDDSLSRGSAETRTASEIIFARIKVDEEASLRDGYSGTRTTAVPVWNTRMEGGFVVGLEALIQYELELNHYVRDTAPHTLLLCQYRTDTWHPRTLKQVLTVHPFAVVGREVYHNFYYVPYSELTTGEDRSAVYLRWWLRNLKDRKKTEKALIAAKEAAVAASKAKSAFLATVSHEIRNPLNGIVGMTDLLLDAELGNDQHAGLEVISSCAGHLLNVINDVLDSAHMESGKLVLNIAPFELRDCIKEAMAVCKVAADQKSLVVSSVISPDCPTTITGDVLRLRQILINLLSNSVKFSQKGEIVLSCRKLPEDQPASANEESLVLRFSVKDEGIGISQDNIPKLFQQFSQVDITPSRPFGGTGLGLAISRRLVEMAGGRIWVKSAYGVGTKFSFTYPTTRVERDATMDRASIDKARATRDYSQLSLLVAEDDITNQKVIMRMLNKFGCKVRLVGNGLEAWKHAMNEKYDLILMDLHMPEMDGWEALKRIKEEAPAEHQAPVYAMTAGTLSAEEATLFAGTLVKPFTLRDLEAVLSNNLRADQG